MHIADVREELFTGINITVRKSLCENSWIRLMTGDFDLCAELRIIIAHHNCAYPAPLLEPVATSGAALFIAAITF
jgi:hypothetical protein